MFIEFPHQQRSRHVIDDPQGRHHAGGTARQQMARNSRPDQVAPVGAPGLAGADRPARSNPMPCRCAGSCVGRATSTCCTSPATASPNRKTSSIRSPAGPPGHLVPSHEPPNDGRVDKRSASTRRSPVADPTRRPLSDASPPGSPGRSRSSLPPAPGCRPRCRRAAQGRCRRGGGGRSRRWRR